MRSLLELSINLLAIVQKLWYIVPPTFLIKPSVSILQSIQTPLKTLFLNLSTKSS
ncbi:hypothetical protein [Spiroplasma endosymbiont of Polydrusus pterygomalis]|uniref:hypothetical protein n=1 Tax=Spiroplasma endosymbiont of Polydrusus pterygomalis TaxID=3139327 RepID=UPI003CCAEFCC